jgi:hypothetical protein
MHENRHDIITGVANITLVISRDTVTNFLIHKLLWKSCLEAMRPRPSPINQCASVLNNWTTWSSVGVDRIFPQLAATISPVVLILLHFVRSNHMITLFTYYDNLAACELFTWLFVYYVMVLVVVGFLMAHQQLRSIWLRIQCGCRLMSYQEHGKLASG